MSVDMSGPSAPDAARNHAARNREYDTLLDAAHAHARAWLADLDERAIPATATVEGIKAVLGGPLAADGADPLDVLDELATGVGPGLIAMPSPRFYGWVIGGTYPIALAADWLVGAWDQASGMRTVTTGVVGTEEIAGEWLLDLLGLPRDAAVGFVTGATMASFVGLAAARARLLGEAGWDVNARGLIGAPPIQLIAGAERHGAIDLAARYLGLGAATLVESDAQGRIRVDRLRDALASVDGSKIVALQAGNLHSGAFDDFKAAIAVAHAAGAWVHIDGAFGLWAGASPRFRHLVEGFEQADSWATDAHKTLNVPYDCGVAIVADPRSVQTALGIHASYLEAAQGALDPYDKTPELSRRARGVPVWATLRWLGRSGVAGLVDGLVDAAAALAAGLAAIPGVSIVNDVVFTQVCMAMEDDSRTAAVSARLVADGVAFASPWTWHDRAVLRFSVSNRATDAAQVERTLDAVRRAVAGA